MHIDRMKRHARGTKPLRGKERDLAKYILAGAPRRPGHTFSTRKVLDGLEPWPEITCRPACAHIRGGAR